MRGVDGDELSSRSLRVASPVPTTHGMPSSRETIAAWQVIPPLSVTIAAERRISGTQSGEVMCVTSTSPLARLPESASVVRMRTAPLPEPGAPPSPCSSTLPGCAAAVGDRSGRRLRDSPMRTERGDRPALKHPELAVGVKGEFSVLRRAVVLFDRATLAGNRDYLVVGEHRLVRLLFSGRPRGGSTVSRRLDDELLVVHLAREHRSVAFSTM